MKHIVTLLVKELKKRCKEQLEIELTVRDSAKSFIVDKAYDRKDGARPLKRKLQEQGARNVLVSMAGRCV